MPEQPIASAIDHMGPNERAEALHFDRWTQLQEYTADGHIIIYMDRLLPVTSCWVSINSDRQTLRYQLSLADLMDLPPSLQNFSLHGSKLIKMRSTGCPMISPEMDERFSLNYGSPTGVMRLKVGVPSTSSPSNFLTEIIIAPSIDVDPVLLPDGTVLNRMPCRPDHGARAYMKDIAKRVPQLTTASP